MMRIMKRFLGILLAAALLALCLTAGAEVDLVALKEANTFYRVPDVYPTVVDHIVFLDLSTGEETLRFDSYLCKDEQMGLLYTVIANGNIQIWGGGNAYGYLAESEQPYTICFVGNMYEEIMLTLLSQNLGEFFDTQTLIAEETSPDGKLLLTLETPITEDIAAYKRFAGMTLVAHYTVNADNLIIESGDISIRDENGAEKKYVVFSLEVDPKYELPFDLTVLTQPEATREVHVIMEYGTENEFDYVLEAPLNMPIDIFLPTGYVLYEDAACTVLSTKNADPDENGHYPAVTVLYCAPAAE